MVVVRPVSLDSSHASFHTLSTVRATAAAAATTREAATDSLSLTPPSPVPAVAEITDTLATPTPTATHRLWQPTAACIAPALDALDGAGWAALRNRGLAALRAGKRVPVVYVHVFKAGGTAVCDAAKAAIGGRTPRTSAESGVCANCHGNCNMPAGFFGDNNATEQARVLHERSYEFVGNEFDGVPADGARVLSPACAVWAISLRDPLARFLSHLDTLVKAYERVYGGFNAARGRNSKGSSEVGRDQHVWRIGRASDRVFTDDDLAVLKHVRVNRTLEGEQVLSIDRVTPSEFVRFLRHDAGARDAARRAPTLRSLVGGDFFVRHLAGGFVGSMVNATPEALLASAKARLARLFAIVIITDDLKPLLVDADDPWRVLRVPLGWNEERLRRAPVQANAAASRRSSSNDGAEEKTSHIPIGLLADLRAINAPDVELFAFARELAANRTRTFDADEARRRNGSAVAASAASKAPQKQPQSPATPPWLAELTPQALLVQDLPGDSSRRISKAGWP